MSERVAIMTSGGLDSFIAYFYAIHQGFEPFPIFVNLGQPYYHKEKRAIQSFPFQVTEIVCNVLREEFNNLPTPEQQIIPARNALLAHIGLMYAPRVWIVALKGEIHHFMPDKHPAFFALASGFYTFVFDAPKVVETPFWHLSKAGIVKWYKEQGYPTEWLLKTSSCYNPDYDIHCGACSTCFKRWVAMTLNDIQEDYAHVPYESEAARKLIKGYALALIRQDFSHYSLERIHETMLALAKVGLTFKDYYPDLAVDLPEIQQLSQEPQPQR